MRIQATSSKYRIRHHPHLFPWSAALRSSCSRCDLAAFLLLLLPPIARTFKSKLPGHVSKDFFYRFCLVLSLPFLYFFTFNPHRSLFIDFLSALAFSSALVISIGLALPRLRAIRSLPQFRLLLTRFLSPGVFFHSPKLTAANPIYWSIGSKLKSQKSLESGSWVQVFSNGDVYEGEFHKGKCSGSGVYYYSMSGKYEGDWIDDKYDGHGVETWARGSRYRGQYRQGLRHGIGVYRFYSGDVYAGEWSSGQSHGSGAYTCADGSKYVGEFKWGMKHGLGLYHFRNGDTYSGEYFADKMHGFGVYRFGNGHKYEGAWHEGKRQGLGMYTFRSGETQSGHWQNGVLDGPGTSNSHHPATLSLTTIKVLNAVQEAQQAAEKAFYAPKLDERVSKAVAAANKAANAARVSAVKAVQKRADLNNGRDETIGIVCPVPF
ncbi:unnamed protein product [Rhodiola kirilowii]